MDPMDQGLQRLKQVAEKMREEREQGLEPSVPSHTTREFISWFGYARRSQWLVETIREQLEALDLYTEPDFERAYIDGQIAIRDSYYSDPPADSTLRVDTLNAAHNSPTNVKPNDNLQTAITHMMCNDFSQIPVMTSSKTVKGIITWESIGSRTALGQVGAEVRHYMEPPQVVEGKRPLFEAVDIITRAGYVLVKGLDNTITGIVTASDLNDLFLQLAEPFLLVGEIESHVRRTIHGKFTSAELAVTTTAPANQTAHSIADLSFGDYCRLLENPNLWQKLQLNLDRTVFVDRLDEIRVIRNNVMHFSPDGLDPKDVQKLRDASGFFLRIAHPSISQGGLGPEASN